MPATFDYTGNGNLPSNGNLDDRVKYSYNESSALHIDEEDYGNITSSIDLEEDYGSIANTQTIVGARVLDFGSITINETIVPFGTIFTSSPGEIINLYGFKLVKLSLILLVKHSSLPRQLNLVREVCTLEVKLVLLLLV